MRNKNILIMVLIFSILTLLMVNCAGTKGDEPPDFYGDDTGQQDDLDDIEALLGITSSEETSEQETPAKPKEEELNLLEGNEVLTQEPEEEMAPVQESTDDAKVAELQQELQSKNQQIENLKSDVQSKEAIIEDLSSQTASTPSQSYSPIGSISDSEYEMRYQEGRNAFESRNYEAAIQYFESLLATSTTHSLADNAQYWIGECHYALKQYDAAIIDFEKVLTFPQSNKNVDSQYKLGLCYLRKGSMAKAVEEFERLNADYPGHRFQQRVNKILAEL